MDRASAPAGAVAGAGAALERVDIRLVWEHLVKPGVEQIRLEGGHTDWRPEDVYHEVMIGKAALLANDEGFVILKPRTNEYTLEPELLIWLAWSHAPDFRDRVLPQLDAIGRGMGAVCLRALSHRKGLARTGWKAETIVYKRVL